MRSLAFGLTSAWHGGRRIRDARFEERSCLPVSAACVVSSGVRETLASLFGVPVCARLLEPAIPSAQAWAAIAGGAMLYRLRGSAADAAIVLRRFDAMAIAAAAFGEAFAPEVPERDLSPLERDVLERTVAALAGTLGAICGSREREQLERLGTVGGFVTYFEILLETPVEARIGIALSRDPVPEPHGRLALEDLNDLSLVPSAIVELTYVEAGTLARLTPGAVVRFESPAAFHASLQMGERTLARGACGIRNGRYALAIGAPA